MENNYLPKARIAALLLLAAVLSFLFIAPMASDAENHKTTISAITDKSETVLKLSAASALASAGISAIPGDTATPIADKLADFTEYFLLILCVLFTEKYLITILGAAAFRILIPIACLLGGISLFCAEKPMRALAIKLAVIGLAVYFVIPVSFRVSDMIYAAYDSSIQRTVSSAEELTDKTSELAEAEDEDKGLIASILERISETASTLTDKAADTLNRFVETLAVLIVTSCIIPMLVLLFFFWVIKQLTGMDLAQRLKKLGENRRSEEGSSSKT